MNEIIYQVRNLVKKYDDREVLRVDHLDVRRGEVFALVGPSGAGKSTLLRMLDFLEPPSAGSVWFAGTEFGPTRPAPLHLHRRVTTVFQRPILLSRNVWANAAYGLRLRGERNSRRRIEAALAQVGLAGMASQQARTLSVGEAQRVALARAIVLRPDVLLLDEPTANLDPYNVGLIEEIVRSLNREQGITVVLVTHNVFQARRLAHRVGLILNGEIVEVAGTEAFFESPADPRTAAFVRGEMVY